MVPSSGHAFECRIMDDDEFAIGTETHVEFDSIGSITRGFLEC
jgi:hypothetical protein